VQAEGIDVDILQVAVVKTDDGRRRSFQPQFACDYAHDLPATNRPTLVYDGTTSLRIAYCSLQYWTRSEKKVSCPASKDDECKCSAASDDFHEQSQLMLLCIWLLMLTLVVSPTTDIGGDAREEDLS